MIRTRFASVEYTDWGCLVHMDLGPHLGKPVPAMPHWDDKHYSVIAHRCGYQDDLLTYCREHEVAHLILEEMVWNRPSQVLVGLAVDAPVDPATAAYEEMATQSLQRFARALERPIIGGTDWDAIRNRFLEVLSHAPVS